MLQKVTEQKKYESNRNEEDDEYCFQSKEKEMKEKLTLVTIKMENIKNMNIRGNA